MSKGFKRTIKQSNLQNRSEASAVDQPNTIQSPWISAAHSGGFRHEGSGREARYEHSCEGLRDDKEETKKSLWLACLLPKESTFW